MIEDRLILTCISGHALPSQHCIAVDLLQQQWPSEPQQYRLPETIRMQRLRNSGFASDQAAHSTDFELLISLL